MTTPRLRTGLRGTTGFTLVELIIGVVISMIVLAALFQLVFAQNRMYGTQQGVTDSRQSLRAAGTLIAWELRHASAEEGDFYAVGPDSVKLRSFDGFGVICLKRNSEKQYGLHSVSGDIVVGDSAVIYGVNSNRTADDVWRVVALEKAAPPAGLGMNSTCPLWPDTPPVELGIQVPVASPSDTAGVRVGSLVRAFRQRTYRAIQRDGDWWLAVRQGAGNYELLTGPLEADGFELVYRDENGNATTTPADIRAIEFVIRSEQALARTVDGAAEDSIAMRIEVRG